MTRTLEFHFSSHWGLLLLVAVPLLLVVLFAAERRRVKVPSGYQSPREPEASRRRLAFLVSLSWVAALGGILATGWVLLAGSEDPFGNPVFLGGLFLLGLVVVLAALVLWLRGQSRPVLRYSSVEVLTQVSEGSPAWTRNLAPLLRLLAILLILFALARPQVASTEADVFTEGMDIILTQDVSTSMRAVDFAPASQPRDLKSRIDGAKEVIGNFIRQRKEDRLGLVIFAGKAFTQCPLTLDHSVVHNILRAVKTADRAMIEDGTAIGDAIMVSINRLKDSEAKSRLIILLTDGDDNASEISPLQAAEGAAGEDIMIFPILVGKGGLVPYPAGVDLFGQTQYRRIEIPTNPELLKQIAAKANGKFYRAVDQEALEQDFQDILNHLEKTRLMDPGRFTRNTEVFQLTLLPALMGLLLELALTWTRFRRFP